MDHKILIQKLEPYVKNWKNLLWFKKYLTYLQQYIQYDNLSIIYDSSSNNNNNNNNNNNKNNNNNNNNNNNKNNDINHKKNFEKTELLDVICGAPQA